MSIRDKSTGKLHGEVPLEEFAKMIRGERPIPDGEFDYVHGSVDGVFSPNEALDGDPPIHLVANQSTVYLRAVTSDPWHFCEIDLKDLVAWVFKNFKEPTT